MIVAIVALCVVVGALLLERHRLIADHREDRRELIAAALSGSANEFTGAVRESRPSVPHEDREPVVPMVGM